MDVNKVLLTFIKVGVTIVIVLAVVYAAIRFSGVSYDFGYRIFTEPSIEATPGTDVMVEVKSNMSAKDLGDMLQEKGLIRDANLFVLQLDLSAYKDKIVPGIYTLNTSQTPKEMIVMMCPEDKFIQDTENGTQSNDQSNSTEADEIDGGQE